jgi:two-component system response regulator BaeR
MNATASSPHLLIVEDEPKLAALMADYLRAEHYTVTILYDGNQVIEAVRRENPDLLLLDLLLPG